MSAPAQAPDPFQAAILQFQSELKDKAKYDFSRFGSIDDVYNETDKIQKQNSLMRNLKRIQPLLRRLEELKGVIETFVAAKPELLALIWAPLKYILQISSTYVQSFDIILKALESIGASLPQFKLYGNLFTNNVRVQDVLVVFYQDILDFYVVCLNFFRLPRWKVAFEMIWPRCGEKIKVIKENIERHNLLLRNEVTLADISDARSIRLATLKEFETSQRHRERQDFENLQASLNPRIYDTEVERLRSDQCKGTGDWLLRDVEVEKWLQEDNSDPRFIWLTGIPGAGKSQLSAKLVSCLRERNQQVIFAFLDYRTDSSTIEILQSWTFQLLYDNVMPRPILQSAYENSYRKLRSSLEYVVAIFCQILGTLGTVHLIIDGLDEISKPARQGLLAIALKLLSNCSNLKILVSSRAEADIESHLKSKTKRVHVGQKNTNDIEVYVDSTLRNWTTDHGLNDSQTWEVTKFKRPIAGKSAGMFLYARLVLTSLMAQPNMERLKMEAENLPDGYGRILSRIRTELKTHEREGAEAILRWITCSKVPIRQTELLYAAWVVKPGDFALVEERKPFGNFWHLVLHLVGPIVELRSGYLSFVHFTVKEYLCGLQSGFFVNEVLAHREIAITCMAYLSLDIVQRGSRQSILESDIVEGSYSLLDYATSHWLEHVKMGSPESTLADLETLASSVSQLLKHNELDAPRSEDGAQNTANFQAFEEEWPDIARSLAYVESIQASKKSSLVRARVSSQLELFPLDSTVLSCRNALESLVCDPSRHRDNCHCRELEEYYGEGLFKCRMKFCSFFRTGFKTKSERVKHQRQHDRLFKCPEQNCDFAIFGFTSQQELDKHVLLCHTRSKVPETDSQMLARLTKIDFYHALKDAARMGQLEVVMTLLKIIDLAPMKYGDLSWATTLEMTGNKIDIFKAIFDCQTRLHSRFPREYKLADPTNSLYHAAQYGSIELIEWLLESGASLSYKDDRRGCSAFEVAAAVARADVMKLFLDRDPDQDITNAMMKLLSGRRGDDSTGWMEESQFPREPHATAQILLSYGDLDPQFIQDSSLVFLADGICDIEMGNMLLQLGARIDSKWRDPKERAGIGTITALYAALRKAGRSRHAAEFAKFLLEQGADHRIRCTTRGLYCGNLTGAKKLERYVGVSWDELVKANRAKGTKRKRS